jgi:pimeloyl-ACP methyl ester carboxylesterase
VSQHTSHAKAPNPFLIALEARAPWEWGVALAAWPMLKMMGAWPKPEPGRVHHVIVYPGLAAGDTSTQPLRAFLSDLGYEVHGWYQGMNRGPRKGVLARMQEQLTAVHRDAKEPVSLIGWSLGGVYAREMAKVAPKSVRNVITLGTPFSHGPRSTNAWRVYSALSGESLPDEMMLRQVSAAPPVPFTSVYSKTDGVVAWPASIQKPDADNENIENIEVFASHLGIGANPAAWFAIADRLAQPHGTWQPFAPPLTARFLFGATGR